MPTADGCIPSATLTTRGLRLRLKAQLCPKRHDPFMLQQLYSTGASLWVSLETFFQEINALVT